MYIRAKNRLKNEFSIQKLIFSTYLSIQNNKVTNFKRKMFYVDKKPFSVKYRLDNDIANIMRAIFSFYLKAN